MADKSIIWNQYIGQSDYAITNGDLSYGNDLYTSVIISLFTNRRNDDPTLKPNSYRGGWWGDGYSSQLIGSKLYLLYRAKKINDQQILNQAINYSDEALAWLIANGIAKTVVATAIWLANNIMGLTITITEPNFAINVFNFKWVWDGLNVPSISYVPSVPQPYKNNTNPTGEFILGQNIINPAVI